jgi:DNA-binding winged helix-turn-helix (wHTH) protein
MQIIAKDELTPDVVAFIKSTPNAVTVDFSRLRREFQLEDIDL